MASMKKKSEIVNEETVKANAKKFGFDESNIILSKREIYRLTRSRSFKEVLKLTQSSLMEITATKASNKIGLITHLLLLSLAMFYLMTMSVKIMVALKAKITLNGNQLVGDKSQCLSKNKS